jgi:hypothetical protein
LNVSAISPLNILPASMRTKMPYQPDAPTSDSSKYDPTDLTQKEAAKLATDLYNDGKISFHELGAMMISTNLNLNEDGSPRTEDSTSTPKKLDFIAYAEKSISACQSRNDAQGVKIYQNILDALKQTAMERGRKVNVSV